MATSLAFQDGQAKVSKRVEKELHNTRVVLRRLPPDVTEDKLFEIFTDIPKYNYFYLAGGDPTFGELATSRAYFSFIEESSIIPFRDKYDGFPFESAKGLKYRVVIEFAPYQGIPKRLKKKADSRIATVEQDQDYLTFEETAHFKKEPPTMAEIAAYVDSLSANKIQEVQTTPLLMYLADHRRGGRSSKRSKAPPGESKKKRSKDSKSAKESRSKGEDVSKSSSSSSSGGTKDWAGKSRKERSGKKSDIDTVSSISSTSVEGKATGGGSEKTKEKGKWRDDGRGKGWKESRGWRDESTWDGGSEHDRRKSEGKKEKLVSKGVRKNEEGVARDGDQGGDRGVYREKRSTRRSYDEERKPRPFGVRNRDRPDQLIYSARSKPRGDFNHTYSKDGSSEGWKATKEKSESSRIPSSRSEGWKRRDQVNGEKPKCYGDRDEYSEGGGAKGKSGSSRRGKSRDAGYSESTPSYSEK